MAVGISCWLRRSLVLTHPTHPTPPAFIRRFGQAGLGTLLVETHTVPLLVCDHVFGVALV